LAERSANDSDEYPPFAPLDPALLKQLEASEVVDSLTALLMGRNVEEGLDAAQVLGLFDVWLPEVEKMVGFGDSEWRHKDVWKHTKQVVKQSVRRPEVRWGSLLHDIGKPRTRKIDDRGRVTFHGHAELGAAMYRRSVAPRLQLSGALSSRIHFLILHHLRASQYKASWTDSAVRRFYKQMGDGLRDLLDLSRADITTKRKERKRRGLRQISLLAQRIRGLEEEDTQVAPLPKGLGSVMIERFGLPPSKRLGDLRARLADEATDGTIEAGREVDYYIEHLEANRESYGLI
jgi:poly(A) polymerase